MGRKATTEAWEITSQWGGGTILLMSSAVLPWLHMRMPWSMQAWSKSNRGIWQNAVNKQISKARKTNPNLNVLFKVQIFELRLTSIVRLCKKSSLLTAAVSTIMRYAMHNWGKAVRTGPDDWLSRYHIANLTSGHHRSSQHFHCIVGELGVTGIWYDQSVQFGMFACCCYFTVSLNVLLCK